MWTTGIVGKIIVLPILFILKRLDPFESLFNEAYL